MYYYLKNNIKISNLFHIIYYFENILLQFFIFMSMTFYIFDFINIIIQNKYLIDYRDSDLY